MRTFFTYTYSAYTTNHEVLKDIYEVALSFHRLAQNNQQPLNKTEINNLVIQYENLFLQLNYKFVKSINHVVFPYDQVSRLAETLTRIAALVRSSRGNDLTEREYQHIVQDMVLTVPYIFDLLKKHETVVVAIPSVNNTFKNENVQLHEKNKKTGLNKAITSSEDPNYRLKILQKSLPDFLTLKTSIDQKNTYSPLPVDFVPLTQQTIVKLELKKIDRILVIHSDPYLLQQFDHLQNHLHVFQQSPLNINTIFALCKILTFVSEASRHHHLRHPCYDTAEMVEINEKLYAFRNQLAHSLDYESAAITLENLTRTQPQRFTVMVSLLENYIKLLNKVSRQYTIPQSTITIAYQHEVEKKTQRDLTNNILTTNLPNLTNSLALTRAQGGPITPQEKLDDFIYHAHAIEVLLKQLRDYCTQSNLLTPTHASRLFVDNMNNQKSYHQLTQEELTRRLVLEGIAEALGEVTGTLMGKGTTVSLLVELGINAEQHKDIEEFIVILTDYRNTSTHLLRYTDIIDVIERLLSTTAQPEINLQNLVTEVKTACQTKWHLTATTQIENPAFKNSCSVM